MKVYVTGVCGQLGHDVMNELARRGHEGIGSDLAPAYGGAQDGSAVCSMPYERLDITDTESVRESLLLARPDAVIHCAAWTAVDAAEDQENKNKVHAINAEGTRHIAQVCRELGCKLMYISTDYVFDGQGESPWQPDCEDYAPLNVYGQTKLEGELAVRELVEKFFIVRLGIWPEWEQLYQNHAASWTDASHPARGQRPGRHANLHAGSGAAAGGHD